MAFFSRYVRFLSCMRVVMHQEIPGGHSYGVTTLSYWANDGVRFKVTIKILMNDPYTTLGQKSLFAGPVFIRKL